jgi:hypothetical protein
MIGLVKRSRLPSDITMEALATMDALARRGIEVDGPQWLGHGLADDGRPYHGFSIAGQARYFTLDGSEIEADR